MPSRCILTNVIRFAVVQEYKLLMSSWWLVSDGPAHYGMSEERISHLRSLLRLIIRSFCHTVANQSTNEPMMHTRTRPCELETDWKAKECGESMNTTSFEME